MPSRRNRHLATLLSSVWPGLGQLALGARRAGLALALPPLGLLVLAVAAALAPDRLSRVALLLDPAVLASLLVAELLLLGWRLVATADAFRRGEGRLGGPAAALTAVGLLFVLVPSAYAAYLTGVAYAATTSVFSAVEPQTPATPLTPPRTPEPDPEFIATGTPEPSTAPDLGRFTVLFIGGDSGPNRDHFLTDTMMIASLDPVSGSVSMVSMPRDTVDVPLGDGRTFRGKINSLVSYARNHPGQFPGTPSGETVLANALGALLGVQVDGWVEVNLPGFVDVVDSLKGIDVTVHDGFCDPTYHDYGFPNGFSVTPGRWHFDGQEALGYARVRKATGESDFTRAARQQEIIVALRDRVVSGGFVNDPARFIASFGNLVRTNLRPAQLVPYVEAASAITRDRIYRQVVTYPLIHYLAGDPRGWVVALYVDKIRALGARAFPPAGTLPTSMDTIPPDDGTQKRGSPTSCLPLATPPPTATASSSPTAPGSPTPVPSDAATPPPTPEPTPTLPTPTVEPAPTETPPPGS
jgi:LCP family protein required for cell wall assembly